MNTTLVCPPPARQHGESLAAHAMGQGVGTTCPVADSQRFGMSESAKQLFALLARRDFLMQCPTDDKTMRIRRHYGFIPADVILFHLDIQIWQQVVYLMSGELVVPDRRKVGGAA